MSKSLLKGIVFFAAFMVVLLMGGTAVFAEEVAVSVTVLDNATGNVVTGAAVTISEGGTAQTDSASGIAKVTIPSTIGNHSIFVTHSDYWRYNGNYTSTSTTASDAITVRMFKKTDVAEVTSGVSVVPLHSGYRQGYALILNPADLTQVSGYNNFKVNEFVSTTWAAATYGIPGNYTGDGSSRNGVSRVVNRTMPAGDYCACVYFYSSDNRLMGFSFKPVTVATSIPHASVTGPSVTFEFTGGVNKDISLQEDKLEYDVEIPDGTGSFGLYAGGNGNTVNSVSLRYIRTHGSSGSEGLNQGWYDSVNGCIVVKADIKIGDQTRLVTFNLYQSTFKGFVVTPNLIAGEWGKTSLNPISTNSVNAYLGAESVRLTLPDILINKVKSFTVAGLLDQDAAFVKNGENDYTITLSNNTSYCTKVDLVLKMQDDTTETFRLYINKMALSSGTYGKGNGNFDAKVMYTMDASYSIPDPKLMVIYYYEDAASHKRTALEAKTFDLPDTLDPANPVAEVTVYSANVNDTDSQHANIIGVFLISGEVSQDAAAFGGVKFGTGAGWYEMFPNHLNNPVHNSL